jgi:tetratricopeptide (TPR) repeat protein
MDSATLYHKGRELVVTGDLEGAVKLFDESVRVYPHFKTLELLGECLLKLGRAQESVVPLAAATSLNKGVRAATLLAEALLALGERDRAVDVAQEALRRDPNNRKAKTILDSLLDHTASRSQ